MAPAENPIPSNVIHYIDDKQESPCGSTEPSRNVSFLYAYTSCSECIKALDRPLADRALDIIEEISFQDPMIAEGQLKKILNVVVKKLETKRVHE